MKFHWGTGIAIVYGTFMLLMITFVIKSKQIDHSLVTENYYEQDLAYQSHLDKVNNAQALPEDLRITGGVNADLEFQFPSEMQAISGEIWLYRANNTALDMKIPITTQADNSMRVPTRDLIAGRWRVKVDWQGSGKAFFTEQEILIP